MVKRVGGNGVERVGRWVEGVFVVEGKGGDEGTGEVRRQRSMGMGMRRE